MIHANQGEHKIVHNLLWRQQKECIIRRLFLQHQKNFDKMENPNVLAYFSRSFVGFGAKSEEPQQQQLLPPNLPTKNQAVLTPTVEDDKRFFPSSENSNHSQKDLQIQETDDKFENSEQEFSEDDTSEKERKHVCTVCGKAYFYHQNLSVHMKIHNTEGRPEECQICHARFGKKSSMRIHISCTHLKNIQAGNPEKLTEDEKDWTEEKVLALIKEKSYSCDKCEKMFSTQGKLKKHCAKHDDLKHICTHCGEKFAFYFEYQKHLKTKHPHGTAEVVESTGRVKCEFCSKDFKNIDSLKFHIKEKHSEKEEEVFRCPHEGCMKCFNRKANLNAHLRKVHLKLESGLWICSACKTELSTKATFKRHLKNIHGKPETEIKTASDAIEKIFKQRMQKQQQQTDGSSETSKKSKRQPKKKIAEASSSSTSSSPSNLTEIALDETTNDETGKRKFDEAESNPSTEDAKQDETEASTSCAPPRRKRRKLNNVMKTINTVFGKELKTGVTILKDED